LGASSSPPRIPGGMAEYVFLCAPSRLRREFARHHRIAAGGGPAEAWLNLRGDLLCGSTGTSGVIRRSGRNRRRAASAELRALPWCNSKQSASACRRGDSAPDAVGVFPPVGATRAFSVLGTNFIDHVSRRSQTVGSALCVRVGQDDGRCPRFLPSSFEDCSEPVSPDTSFSLASRQRTFRWCGQDARKEALYPAGSRLRLAPRDPWPDVRSVFGRRLGVELRRPVGASRVPLRVCPAARDRSSMSEKEPRPLSGRPSRHGRVSSD